MRREKIKVGVLIIVAAVIIAVIIIVKSTNSQKPKRSFLYDREVPNHLGIRYGEKGAALEESFESSLSTSYMEQVKERVAKEHGMKPHEIEWATFELKRYFLMNAVIKNVPMFSSKVDDVWHEMIMFTMDYERFTKGFYSRFLHHQPNTNSEASSEPGKRAFFDWVYTHLFDVKDNSRLLWGRFFQHPIPRSILKDFHQLSEEKLIDKYFTPSDEWDELKKALVRQLKGEIKQAEHLKQNAKQEPFSKKSKKVTEVTLFQAFIFYSLYEAEDFGYHMGMLMKRPETSDSGTYSSGYACSTPMDDSHHKHGHGGHDSNDSSFDSGGDSGGSSCSSSSCGSGCGSS